MRIHEGPRAPEEGDIPRENPAPAITAGEAPSPASDGTEGERGLGTAALILALFGFLTGFLLIGIALDLLAIVLGALSLRRGGRRGLPTAAILVSVLSLGLCLLVFGGSWINLNPPMSKAETIARATRLDFRELAIQRYANEAAFNEEYQDAVCILQGYVDDIREDEAVIVWRTGGSYFFTQEELDRMGGDEFFAATYSLRVSFVQEEELKALQKGQEITVTGVLDPRWGTVEEAYTMTG